jgi:L-alanine-DL-glutamate epimerase-like enolase superfamily enzyme
VEYPSCSSDLEKMRGGPIYLPRLPVEIRRAWLVKRVVEEPFDLVDGYVLAAERPGLGLTLRRDFAREITVPV